MIPIHNNLIYTISDLFSYASQAHLSPSQLDSVHKVMDLVSSDRSTQAPRKRRTGRGREPKPKAQRVSAAVNEGTRRRRGIWGWNPHHEPVQQPIVESADEGSWRHSPALVLSQA